VDSELLEGTIGLAHVVKAATLVAGEKEKNVLGVLVDQGTPVTCGDKVNLEVGLVKACDEASLCDVAHRRVVVLLVLDHFVWVALLACIAA